MRRGESVSTTSQGAKSRFRSSGYDIYDFMTNG